MIVSISGAQLAGADPASAHEFFDNWFAGRLSSKPLRARLWQRALQ